MGLDFLVDNKVILDFEKNIMKVSSNNLTIPLTVRSYSQVSTHVNATVMFLCDDFINLTPYTLKFIEVESHPWLDESKFSGQVFLKDRPFYLNTSKLRVSPGINSIKHGKCKVLINNIGNKPIFLSKKSAIVDAWPILKVGNISKTNKCFRENFLYLHENWSENFDTGMENNTFHTPDSNINFISDRSSKDNIEINSITSPPNYNGFIINENLSDSQKIELKNILNEFSSIFCDNLSDLKPSKVGYHQIRSGDRGPLCLSPQPLPPKYRDEVRSQISDMLKAGIIQECKSEWASAIVVTKRKNNKIRIVYDYRLLNKLVTPDKFPLPLISNTIDIMSNCCYFTHIDLFSGYHQIKLAAKDRLKTAFRTPDGLYCFRAIPRGTINASATFSRVMTRVLSKVLYRHTVFYIDDLCIFSKSFKLHLKHIKEVLTILKDAGLQCGRLK